MFINCDETHAKQQSPWVGSLAREALCTGGLGTPGGWVRHAAALTRLWVRGRRQLDHWRNHRRNADSRSLPKLLASMGFVLHTMFFFIQSSPRMHIETICTLGPKACRTIKAYIALKPWVWRTSNWFGQCVNMFTKSNLLTEATLALWWYPCSQWKQIVKNMHLHAYVCTLICIRIRIRMLLHMHGQRCQYLCCLPYA